MAIKPNIDSYEIESKLLDFNLNALNPVIHSKAFRNYTVSPEDYLARLRIYLSLNLDENLEETNKLFDLIEKKVEQYISISENVYALSRVLSLLNNDYLRNDSFGHFGISGYYCYDGIIRHLLAIKNALEKITDSEGDTLLKELFNIIEVLHNQKSCNLQESYIPNNPLHRHTSLKICIQWHTSLKNIIRSTLSLKSEIDNIFNDEYFKTNPIKNLERQADYYSFDLDDDFLYHLKYLMDNSSLIIEKNQDISPYSKEKWFTTTEGPFDALYNSCFMLTNVGIKETLLEKNNEYRLIKDTNIELLTNTRYNAEVMWTELFKMHSNPNMKKDERLISLMDFFDAIKDTCIRMMDEYDIPYDTELVKKPLN